MIETQMHAEIAEMSSRGTALRLVVGARMPAPPRPVLPEPSFVMHPLPDHLGSRALKVRIVKHTLLIILVCLACVCLAAMAASAQTLSPTTASPAKGSPRTGSPMTGSSTRGLSTTGASTPALPAVPQPASIAGVDDETASFIEDAIVEAVQTRMGDDVDVRLQDARARLVGELPDDFVAVPDVGAQTGGSVRFMLVDAPRDASESAASAKGVAHARRLGSVDTKVFVTGPRIVARDVIARGTEIAAADIDASIGDIGRQPMKPLVDAARIVGSRAVRTIAAGEVITSTLVASAPLVQSGDEVKTRVRIGGLEARGMAVAAQNGALGEEIILIAESKRRLKGRVIGEREVEVLHD